MLSTSNVLSLVAKRGFLCPLKTVSDMVKVIDRWFISFGEERQDKELIQHVRKTQFGEKIAYYIDVSAFSHFSRSVSRRAAAPCKSTSPKVD